jgi:hypothetical protein
LEEALINEYQYRNQPDPSLPSVPFYKRNGYYWVGQRRFEPVLEDQVYVKEGRGLTPFSIWISEVERVEALRFKGLQSAQLLLLQQSAFTKQAAPKI